MAIVPYLTSSCMSVELKLRNYGALFTSSELSCCEPLDFSFDELKLSESSYGSFSLSESSGGCGHSLYFSKFIGFFWQGS